MALMQEIMPLINKWNSLLILNLIVFVSCSSSKESSSNKELSDLSPLLELAKKTDEATPANRQTSNQLIVEALTLMESNESDPTKKNSMVQQKLQQSNKIDSGNPLVYFTLGIEASRRGDCRSSKTFFQQAHVFGLPKNKDLKNLRLHFEEQCH